MRLLTQKEIQDRFSDNTFVRGKNYFKRGLVHSLSADEGESFWTAKVKGNDQYNVEVELSDGEIGHYHCDCPAHSQYGSCKHTVATLLQIVQLKEDAQPRLQSAATPISIFKQEKKESTSTLKLIQMFSNLKDLPDGENDQHSLRIPLKVEYICKLQPIRWDSDLLSIEMKVGIDRVYVVKSMKDFLKHIDQQEEYLFTKNFSYDPLEHYFEEADREIIQLLLNIYKSETFYRDQDRWTYSTSSYANAKGLNIPPLFADQLFSKLSARDCTFDDGEFTYPRINWFEGELPFSFLLEKEKIGYKLDLHLFQDVNYIARYGYILSKNDFYKLTNQQKVLMEEMTEVLDIQGDRYISIEDEQIHSFVSHVLPGLKKIGNLEVDEQVSKHIINPPLQAKMYLDQRDDRLLARLEYHYDDIVITPFDENQVENRTDQILMRQVEEENNVMRTVELAAFKFNGSELFIEDEEEIFRFMHDILPKLEHKADVYMTNEVRRFILEDRHYPKVQVNLESTGGLLEVNFDFEGIGGNEINDIIQSIIEKKKYYRLPNGTFVPLEDDEFIPISELFGGLNLKSDDFRDGSIKLPAYRGLQIDELLSKRSGSKYNKAFRQLIEEIKNPENSEYSLPESLVANLRDYQNTGFQWLKALSHYHFGGILADDMGLGKTLQSIAFLLSELEKHKESQKPALVVSPASLVYNWKSEFEKFAPSMKVQVIYGSKQEREALLENFHEVDVVITSYPLIRQDIESYLPYEFSTLILDEAQAIKNHATKTAKMVKSIRAARRFALSGTPIENSLDELWSLFDAILPGFFPSKKAFGQLQQEQISRMSRPFILRRVKKEVLKELPDKIETTHTSELTKEQKQLYLGYLERIQGEASLAMQTNSFQQSRMKILAGLTRLRQLCCHPSLFIENYEGESGKLIQLIEIVENAIENGQRILIFSQFASMLQIIHETMKNAGRDTFYLDGQTPSKDRVKMAERFNDGEKEIFLISLKAGGTGLNLTGADTVILYDLWWNPAVEEQAAGRAHRMGQKKVVQVIRMITQGTIEEKIFALQQKKKELIDNIIQPGETMLSALSEGEIRELLSLE